MGVKVRLYDGANRTERFSKFLALLGFLLVHSTNNFVMVRRSDVASVRFQFLGCSICEKV